MAYFALFYDTVADFVERRTPFRAEHLALVDAAYRGGSLVLAGALKPVRGPSTGAPPAPGAGALLVFRVDSADKVARFAASDPYVANGLVRSWRVDEWAVVVGEHAIPR